MAIIDDELTAEQKRLRRELNIGVPSNYRREDFNEQAFAGHAEDLLGQDLYKSGRARGHNPEVSNIVANHGILREPNEGIQGPMQDGRTVDMQRILELSPAAPKQGLVPDMPLPNWSQEQQGNAISRDARNNATGGLEALTNNMRLDAAEQAEFRTQARRDRGGVGITREEQYRRTQGQLARIDGLEQAGQRRDLARDLAAQETATAQASQPRAPELGINPLPGGGSAVTYGNNLEVTGNNGGSDGPRFDDVTGRLLGNMVDGKFVRYEHPQNPYPNYDSDNFQAWNDSNPIPTKESYKPTEGADDGIPTLTPEQAATAAPGTKFRTSDGRILVR